MSSFPWRVVASAVACVLASNALLGSVVPQQGLDPILTAYAGGDHDVVARSFARSNDFLKYNLFDRRKVEAWLGPWSPDKAVLIAEIIERSASVAPQYIPNLVSIGQRYVLNRPSQPGTLPREDDLERKWHLIALSAMQRHYLDANILQYIDALGSRRPGTAAAAVLDPRIELARGVAQEQQCRSLQTTARQDRVPAEIKGVFATPLSQQQIAGACMRTAWTTLESAAGREEVREEGRVRAGFVAFQLGQNDEAKALLAGARPGDDRQLAYWSALFTGRVADALGEDAGAETAYRAALALYPEAQSARIGLALALFRMNRSDDAETAMRAARQIRDDAIDPWENYFTADGRFLADWVVSLRKARQ